MKVFLLLKVIFALFLIPSLAVAQGVCESLDRIIDSGINNGFDAVAGHYLPNANECMSRKGSTNSVYECNWGDQEAIERYRDLRSEGRRQYVDNDLKLRRQFREDIISSSSASDRERINDAYDRRRDEIEDAFEKVKRAQEAVEESFSREAKRESGRLYQAMYGCFQTGVIADATAYNLTNDSDDNGNDWTWSKQAGCSIRISSNLDTRLRLICPKLTQ